jgi:hypothetical protein
MTIALNTVTFRHERRVRLGFTVTLAGGAFAASLYSVTCLDGTASSPGVSKALVVGASPAFVELQLDADLVQGSLYRFSAVGVPGIDATTTPNPSNADARMARETRVAALSTRGAPSDLEERLYGRDVRWSGTDFAETPAGDLDTVSGRECAELDLTARMLEDGLPWDQAFGLGAYEFVDGPVTALGPLRGKAIGEMRKDDRVASGDASIDLSDPENPILEARPVLVGDALFGGAGALEVRVPAGRGTA